MAVLYVIREDFVITGMNELVSAQSSNSEVGIWESSLNKSKFWSVPMIAF